MSVIFSFDDPPPPSQEGQMTSLQVGQRRSGWGQGAAKILSEKSENPKFVEKFKYRTKWKVFVDPVQKVTYFFKLVGKEDILNPFYLFPLEYLSESLHRKGIGALVSVIL